MGKFFAIAVLFAVTVGGLLYVKSHPEIIAEYFHKPVDLQQTSARPHPASADNAAEDQPVQRHDQGVYRWVDERGGVHYGDAPPARQDHVSQLRRLDMQPLPAITLEPIASRDPAFGGDATPRAVGGSLVPQPVVEEMEPAGSLCEHAAKELAALRARMRRGYSAAESPRLLSEELRLRNLVAQYCR